MNDKELLQRLRQIFIERQNQLMSTEKNNFSSNESSNDNSNGEHSYGGHQKTLGAHPGTGNLFESYSKEDKIPTKNGFSTMLMLGFLTFFFEVMFITISYFIFK